MNFATSPEQSNLLQATNIQAPVDLSDADAVNNPVVKRQRKLEGIGYHDLVTANLKLGRATGNDFESSSKYLAATQLAEFLQPIQRNIAPVAAAEIAQLLAPQFQQINVQFLQSNAKSTNHDVDHDNDEIVWFPKPPVFEVNEINQQVIVQPPVPDFAPQTKGELFHLNHATANLMLQYYDLAANGTLDDKRKRLARHVGLPRILWR